MKQVSLSLAVLLLLAACSPPATAPLPTETAAQIAAETPVEVVPTHTAQSLPTQAPSEAPQPVELSPLDVGPLPELVAYSQNFLHLYAGASFDFDAGSGISVPIPPEEDEDAPDDAELIPTGLFTADIRYVPFDPDGSLDTEIVIAADAPSLVALWGDVEPSLDDCQNVSLAEEPLALADLTPGAFVCFLTDTGSYGYFQVVGRYFDPQQAWTETLDITYTIWDAETREALIFPALQAVRESTLAAAGADLDYGGNRRNIDLNFALPNDEQTQIFPVNGARLSYWGKAS
ncbi:MAG: hypothetical protein JXB38_08000, partial [Anaerolineales bacterium]|nr:hypothetical protein [Anaerolineales bacterium]